MMTIEQIAEKMGVSKTEAYGLVRFFERTGVLKTAGKAPRDEHQRGRSEHLYQFSDETVSSAAYLLGTLIEDETPAAAPVEETCTILPESAPEAAAV